jgi:hypothetical protein
VTFGCGLTVDEIKIPGADGVGDGVVLALVGVGLALVGVGLALVGVGLGAGATTKLADPLVSKYLSVARTLAFV